MFKLLFLNLLSTSRCDRTLSPTHRTLSPTHRTLSPTHRTLSPKNRLFLLVKNHRKEEGFSILEVLVTILVITGFILGSLQATVLATFMRVQAQDKQEAANWVQQDLELIRYEAFILDSGGVDTATCTASTYGTRLRDVINGTFVSSTTGTPVKIFDEDGNPSTNPPTGDRWYKVYRNYVPNGNILRVNYVVLYNDGSGGQTHPRYKSSDPYNGKTFDQVTDPDGNPITQDGNSNIVTVLSTEVLPNAALACN